LPSRVEGRPAAARRIPLVFIVSGRHLAKKRPIAVTIARRSYCLPMYEYELGRREDVTTAGTTPRQARAMTRPPTGNGQTFEPGTATPEEAADTAKLREAMGSFWIDGDPLDDAVASELGPESIDRLADQRKQDVVTAALDRAETKGGGTEERKAKPDGSGAGLDGADRPRSPEPAPPKPVEEPKLRKSPAERLDEAVKAEIGQLEGERDRSLGALDQKIAGKRDEITGLVKRTTDDADARARNGTADMALHRGQLENQASSQSERMQKHITTELGQVASASKTEAENVGSEGDTQATAAEERGKTEANEVMTRAGAAQARALATFNSSATQVDWSDFVAANLRMIELKRVHDDTVSRIQQQAQRDAAIAKDRGVKEAARLRAEAQRKAGALRGEAGKEVATLNGVHRVEAALGLSEEYRKGIQELDAAAAGGVDGAAATDELRRKEEAALKALQAERDALEKKLNGEIERRTAALRTRADSAKQQLGATSLSAEAVEKSLEVHLAGIDRSSDELGQIGTQAEQQSARNIERRAGTDLKGLENESKAALAKIDAQSADLKKKLADIAKKTSDAMNDKTASVILRAQRVAKKARDGLTVIAGRMKLSLAAEGVNAGKRIDGFADESGDKMDRLVDKLGETSEEVLTKDIAGEHAEDEKAVEVLDRELDGDADARVVLSLLRGKSPEEIKRIKALYKQKHGKDLDAEILDDLTPAEAREARAYAEEEMELDADMGEAEKAEALAHNQKVKIHRVAARAARRAEGSTDSDEEQELRNTWSSLNDAKERAAFAREIELMTGKRASTIFIGELGDSDEDLIKESVIAVEQAEREQRAKLDPQALIRVRLTGMEGVNDAVKGLRLAMEKSWVSMEGATNEKAIRDLMTGKSPEEIAVIEEEYERQYGISLKGHLEKELSGRDLIEAKAALSGDQAVWAGAALDQAENPKRMRAVLDSITDPETRARAIEEFELRTGKSLREVILDKADDGFAEKDEQWLLTSLVLDNDVRAGELGAIEIQESASMNHGGLIDWDKNKFFAALDRAETQEQKDILIAAYKRQTGNDVFADARTNLRAGELFDDQDSKAQDALAYWASGEKEKELVARMLTSREDGEDQKMAFAQLERAANDPELRARMEAQFPEMAGMSFSDFRAQFTDMNSQKLDHLMRDGKVPPWFAAKYALDGPGTDFEDLRRIIPKLSPADLEEFKAHTGLDLKEVIEDQDSLSSQNEDELLVYVDGVTKTSPQDKIDQVKRLADIAKTGLQGAICDATSGLGDDIDRRKVKVQLLEQKLKSNGELTAEEQRELDETLAHMRLAGQSFQTGADEVGDSAIDMIGTAVDWAASLTGTGGLGSAVVKLVVGVGGKLAMKGTEGVQPLELLGEYVKGSIEVNMAALELVGVPKSATGLIAGLLKGLADGLLDPNAMRDPDEWLKAITMKTGVGGLQGAATGLLAQYGGDLFKTPLGQGLKVFASKSAAVGNALVNAIGSALIGRLTNPETYKGELDDAFFGTLLDVVKNTVGNVIGNLKEMKDVNLDAPDAPERLGEEARKKAYAEYLKTGLEPHEAAAMAELAAQTTRCQVELMKQGEAPTLDAMDDVVRKKEVEKRAGELAKRGDLTPEEARFAAEHILNGVPDEIAIREAQGAKMSEVGERAEARQLEVSEGLSPAQAAVAAMYIARDVPRDKAVLLAAAVGEGQEAKVGPIGIGQKLIKVDEDTYVWIHEDGHTESKKGGELSPEEKRRADALDALARLKGDEEAAPRK
jgi:hypothetical protein